MKISERRLNVWGGVREAASRMEEDVVSGGFSHEYDRGSGIGSRAKKVNEGVIENSFRI